jgi:hypothetical protein
MSCITPKGQITEQYTLPKRRVRISSAATTPTFRASTAGRNCTLAIHPNHACSAPVTSRKSRVMQVKKILANVIRIFLSIMIRFIV